MQWCRANGCRWNGVAAAMAAAAGHLEVLKWLAGPEVRVEAQYPEDRCWYPAEIRQPGSRQPELEPEGEIYRVGPHVGPTSRL